MPEDERADAWAAVADEGTATALVHALRKAGMSAPRVERCTAMTHEGEADAPQALVLGLPFCAPLEASAAHVGPGNRDVPVIAIGPAGETDVDLVVAKRRPGAAVPSH